MPGVLGVLGRNPHRYDHSFLSETLDFLSIGETKTVYFDAGFISVSALFNTPLKDLLNKFASLEELRTF